jgi:6,7-dimethyl-8-ribityllumazine synthase
MPETLPSDLDGAGLRVAVLTARWHGTLTAGLQRAALEVLARAGVREEDVLVVPVPGAYELPLAAAWMARRGDVDAVVALGCVIRGETPHFEHVARCCTDGLLQVGLETGRPVALGVVTAETRAQAEARSAPGGEPGRKGGNKGAEAADAAVRMACLRRALDARRGTS